MGGNTLDFGIYLTTPAPAGGSLVGLASSNSAVSVQKSIYIPAGAFFGGFTASITPVGSAEQIRILSSYGGSVNQADLILLAPILGNVSLPVGSVTGGSSVSGTVTLLAPAPTGGAVVKLLGNSAAATVPISVTVPAGATTATFPVKTSSVKAQVSLKVSATYSGVTQTAYLSINPA
jgi:hypothetical protein